MNKKIKYLTQFLLLFFLALNSNLLHADALFDDLFKGVDMDQFLKDLETESEKETDSKIHDEPIKPSISDSGAKNAESIVITSTPSTKPQTRDELFITPVVQTIQEKGRQARTVPTSSSIKAFKEVMSELVTILNAIQIKVNGSSIFSLPFKEQFSPYWQTIDKIAIAYGTMISKKLYVTIIPFKPAHDPKKEKETKETKKPQSKELESMRQNILDTIKELKNLDKEIEDAIAREEIQPTSDATLEELAKKSRDLIDFDEAPIVSKRTKPQHQKNKKSHHVKQKKEIKKTGEKE